MYQEIEFPNDEAQLWTEPNKQNTHDIQNIWLYHCNDMLSNKDYV